MVAQAKAKAADRSGPVRFLVADIASFEDEEGFDLTVRRRTPGCAFLLVASTATAGTKCQCNCANHKYRKHHRG
jgi:hypothetical protein